MFLAHTNKQIKGPKECVLLRFTNSVPDKNGGVLFCCRNGGKLKMSEKNNKAE